MIPILKTTQTTNWGLAAGTEVQEMPQKNYHKRPPLGLSAARATLRKNVPKMESAAHLNDVTRIQKFDHANLLMQHVSRKINGNRNQELDAPQSLAAVANTSAQAKTFLDYADDFVQTDGIDDVDAHQNAAVPKKSAHLKPEIAAQATTARRANNLDGTLPPGAPRAYTKPLQTPKHMRAGRQAEFDGAGILAKKMTMLGADTTQMGDTMMSMTFERDATDNVLLLPQTNVEVVTVDYGKRTQPLRREHARGLDLQRPQQEPVANSENVHAERKADPDRTQHAQIYNAPSAGAALLADINGINTSVDAETTKSLKSSLASNMTQRQTHNAYVKTDDANVPKMQAGRSHAKQTDLAGKVLHIAAPVIPSEDLTLKPDSAIRPLHLVQQSGARDGAGDNQTVRAPAVLMKQNAYSAQHLAPQSDYLAQFQSNGVYTIGEADARDGVLLQRARPPEELATMGLYDQGYRAVGRYEQQVPRVTEYDRFKMPQRPLEVSERSDRAAFSNQATLAQQEMLHKFKKNILH